MDKGNKTLKIVIVGLLVIAVCAVCILIEMVREALTFTVTHYELETEKLSGEQKVVVLSDLHNCMYGEKNQKLLKSIEKEQPDFILVAGDILVGKQSASTEVAEQFMRDVSQIAPVYYGNGNHEQRMKEQPEYYGRKYADYKHILEEAQVTLLENETVSLEMPSGEIDITGLEIPLQYYRKLSRDIISLEEIENLIGKPDKEKFQILIAHNPVYAKQYAEWGADLILSGHLHGGIVRIPFLGGIVSPQIKLFPEYSGGKYQVGDSDLVVSRGLGTHTIKVRLFNEAEVVVLHIKGTK